MISYVTYDEAGNLTGAYLQALLPEHAANHIEVTEAQRRMWLSYKANDARDGMEIKVYQFDINAAKLAKNAQINNWRDGANSSSFTYMGEKISIDEASRYAFLGIAGGISMTGELSSGFPMKWKTLDNSYLDLPDVNAFKDLFSALIDASTANFNQSEVLKAELIAATKKEEVDAIVWQK